jgi:hypothetical protein
MKVRVWLAALTESVTVGHDKSAVATGVVAGLPDSLIQQVGKVNIEALGAVAAADAVGESDVRAVVLRIAVLAVPARGEVDLGADAIGTVLLDELLVRKVVAVEGGLGLTSVVQAVEADGALHVGLLGLDAQGGPLVLDGVGLERIPGGPGAPLAVTSNHAEARREGREVVQVVLVIAVGCQGWPLNGMGTDLRKHATNLLDELKLASVGVLEVHRRVPIGRFVLSDTARGAITVA